MCNKLFKLMYKYEDDPRTMHLMDILGCYSVKIFLDHFRRSGSVGFNELQISNLSKLADDCDHEGISLEKRSLIKKID